MQAITTKFHSATNTLPTRISATTSGGVRVYNPFDYSLSDYGNELETVRLVVEKCKWTEKVKYAVASTKEGHIFVPIKRTVVI